MRLQIRKNVFETNSSSTHAICINKKDLNTAELQGTTVIFDCGRFGWEVETYKDIYSRASYLYQAILDINYDNPEECSKVLRCINDTLYDYGIACYFIPPKTDSWGFNEGYIDHAFETKEFVDSVLDSKERLIRYLFGDSIIFTGNDNDDEPLPLDTISEEDYEIYYKGN